MRNALSERQKFSFIQTRSLRDSALPATHRLLYLCACLIFLKAAPGNSKVFRHVTSCGPCLVKFTPVPCRWGYAVAQLVEALRYKSASIPDGVTGIFH